MNWPGITIYSGTYCLPHY